MKQPKPFLSGAMQKRFEALQHCLVPRSEKFDQDERERSASLINGLLGIQSEGSRKQLATFILLIDVISFIRYARLFQYLNPKKQTSIMKMFFDSPIPILRKGFWGLNTLARMGVYGQPELHDEIGYHLRANKT